MIATKEQEREALKKIRKIVEGLGEGSYLSFAFEGCFDIAEENINSDFACSMKQKVESLEEKNKELKDDIKTLKGANENLLESVKESLELQTKSEKNLNTLKGSFLSLLACGTCYLSLLQDKASEMKEEFSKKKSFDDTKEDVDNFFEKYSQCLNNIEYTKKSLKEGRDAFYEATR